MEPLAPPGLIEFTVFGEPAPKGSKSAFAIKKGGQYTGRVAVVEGKTKRQGDWLRRVEEAVQDCARRGAVLIDGPAVCVMRFWLTKPASRPKGRRTWPDRKPDLDKLARAVLDSMTGVLLADDARVVSLVLTKDYVPEGGRPGVVVELSPMEHR